MRIFRLIAALSVAVIMQVHTDAQVLKKVNSAGNTINEANNTVKGTTAAVTDAKASVKALLGGGKLKEANLFAIAGIEYGNEDLDLLKTAIKNVKGVKDVVINYKDGTVTLTIKSKDNATELWDKISHADKLLFRIAQADEKSIILEYKGKNNDHSTVNTENEIKDSVSFAVNRNNTASSPDKNPSQTGKSSVTPDSGNSKAPYFVHFDYNGNSVHLESQKLEKDVCSAVLGGVGKTLTITFYNADAKTGISFTIADILEKIKAKKYEFDSEKTNKEKATWENGTNTKQLNVVFQPGDNRRYQIQCSTDPTFQYQGSGYLNITKLNPNKGGMVEGEFHFSFPVYKTKDGPSEIQQLNSGKFRIAIQK